MNSVQKSDISYNPLSGFVLIYTVIDLEEEIGNDVVLEKNDYDLMIRRKTEHIQKLCQQTIPKLLWFTTQKKHNKQYQHELAPIYTIRRK